MRRPVSLNRLAWGALICFWLAACRPVVNFQEPTGKSPGLSTSPVTGPVRSTQTPIEVSPTPISGPSPRPATFTPVPTPTPTPPPPVRRLTSGGCCTQPFWAPDSQHVLYLDRPSPEAPVGFYQIDLQGGPPELFSDQLGIYSDDFKLRAFLFGGETVVQRETDGTRWKIPSGGRAVSFSPDGLSLAWTAGQSGPPYDSAHREVWISQVDGSQAHRLIQVVGGGFNGWLANDQVLVSGRLAADQSQEGLYAVSLADGQARELASVERIRGTSISTQGSWIAYQVTFASQPEADGLWVLNVHTGALQRLDLFGAYRWRDDRHLLVVPLEVSAASQQLWEVNVENGEAYPLTDPQVTPFKIANGDWVVSPDGKALVFVAAQDGNIWLMDLPTH